MNVDWVLISWHEAPPIFRLPTHSGLVAVTHRVKWNLIWLIERQLKRVVPRSSVDSVGHLVLSSIIRQLVQFSKLSIEVTSSGIGIDWMLSTIDGSSNPDWVFMLNSALKAN